MMADELLNAQDLITAKKHDTFHSEVITGKAGGVSTGANIDYATNAVTAQVQKTLPKVIDDLDWSYVGLFADGVTFTDKTDFAVDAVGTQWIYTGSLPFTATAGTVPSEPTYQVVHVKSASAISNANGGSVQDFIDAQYTTVTELVTGKFQVGQHVRLIDRSYAPFVVFNIGSYVVNGLDIIDAGSGKVAILRESRSVKFEWFGAAGGGVNDSAPCQRAIDYLSALGGGSIYNDSKMFYCNIKWRSYVSYMSPSCDVGFRPFADADVISLLPATSTAKIAFHNLFIHGNPAFSNSTNLALYTTGATNIVDQISMSGTTALIDAGKYNLHLRGESAAGPFVQGFVANGPFRVERGRRGDVLIEGDVIESWFDTLAGGGADTATEPGIHIREVSGSTPQRLVIGNLTYGGNPTSGQTAVKLDGFKSVTINMMNLESMDTLLDITGNGNNGTLILGDVTLQTSHNITTALKVRRARVLKIDSLEILAGGANTITNGIDFGGFSPVDIPQLELPQVRFSNVTNKYVGYDNSVAVVGNALRAYRDMLSVVTDGATIDNITDIFGDLGDNSALVDGDRITIQALGAITITVTNAGNIKTKSGSNLVLTFNENTAFVYNRRYGKWLEV